MMLFHSSCAKWDKQSGSVPRFLLVAQGAASTRTYKCSCCGEYIHIDVDWPEGAIVEPEATFK